jgi:hypothetical protein
MFSINFRKTFVVPAMLTTALLSSACWDDDGDEATPSKDDVRANGKADDGHDWCEQLGWYGDGICDDFCVSLDPDCSSDGRLPELGSDPRVVYDSRITMSEGLAQVESDMGAVIEAKFELDHDGRLSLSVYPVGESILVDAEKNIFQEAAGDPTADAWAPGVEVFHDQEHLTRSARDLTLVQLSRYSLPDVVEAVEDVGGAVYWAIPTIQEGRAGYGVWFLDDDGDSQYLFLDGGGSRKKGVRDLGAGPGAGATDTRTPELGDDLTVVRQSKLSMSAALRAMEMQHGPAIEAKFELGGDGKLSLSIYPVGQGVGVDSEHNTFFELAGDPTAATFAPSLTEFVVPDEEHLTRSSRDLTLVQTASLTLLQAVVKAEARFPGGMVFWAIPTRRDTRAGYGIYVLAADGSVHYLFVS